MGLLRRSAPRNDRAVMLISFPEHQKGFHSLEPQIRVLWSSNTIFGKVVFFTSRVRSAQVKLGRKTSSF